MNLHFLQDPFLTLLEDIPLYLTATVWIREFLNIYFQNRWSGRNRYQNWSSRLRDFIFVGICKIIVLDIP